MKLVLLRHATRSAFDQELGPAGESPLNAIGLAQAEDLISHLAPKGVLPAPTRLLVSPKLRARQTLTPLARECALELEIDQRLDERKNAESLRDFNERVRAFFEVITEGAASGDKSVVYACTHFDWLEAAALLWPTNFSERESSASWSPLEYQIFRLTDEGLLNTVSRGHVAPRF